MCYAPFIPKNRMFFRKVLKYIKVLLLLAKSLEYSVKIDLFFGVKKAGQAAGCLPRFK